MSVNHFLSVRGQLRELYPDFSQAKIDYISNTVNNKLRKFRTPAHQVKLSKKRFVENNGTQVFRRYFEMIVVKRWLLPNKMLYICVSMN